MKERGILLPIFSLPSKYGIGDFGNEAYEFIDRVVRRDSLEKKEKGLSKKFIEEYT